MKIAMVGSGYVGLVSGICFSDFGHDVVCVDKSSDRIDMLRQGRVPIFEPGLEDLLSRNVSSGRLSFTADLGAAMEGADAVFIAVGTPSRRGDGHADLSYVFAATEEIATHLTPGMVVVTKSTVPVGTNDRIRDVLRKARPDMEIHVASNPEFLREGAAIEDFMRPDRVVVGVESARAAEVMQQIYKPLYLRNFSVQITDLKSAEMIKYAANAFLATKITFINQVATLCEAAGANVQAVAQGIGSDGRIGGKFLRPGPGYGGSCFPKDTKAFCKIASDAGTSLSIVEAVIEGNERQKSLMADKILAAADGTLTGKRVAVLGVTFKPETDDMRDAPALSILPRLRDLGAEIVAVDPEAAREAVEMLPFVSWEDSAYKAAAGADVLVILTEWNQFRALDLADLAGKMKTAALVDLRNVYNAQEARTAGFESYTGVGVPSYG